MSAPGTDSDSDNNNRISPSFDGILGIPRVHRFELPGSPDIDTDNSSDSEIDIREFNNLASTSDSDVSLHYTSEDSNCSSYNSAGNLRCSLYTKFAKETEQTSDYQIKIKPKPKMWSITKELYNREIGNYNNRAKWSSTFYQSVLAIQKLKISKQLKGHDGCVNSLDFNKAGDLLTSGSDDYKICLWDWSRGKCLLKHNSAHTRNIFQTKFLTTQGDIRIVSSARDGLVILTAINNDAVVYSKTIARHDRSCYKVGVHHDLPYVVLSCGEDGVVKNIDIRESPINENRRITNILHVKNTNGSMMHLYGIDINPMNPNEFIINGDDEYVRMYDKRKLTSDPIKTFRRIHSTATLTDDDDDSADSREGSPNADTHHITSAVYSYSGTEILASYSEDDIYLFDVNGLPDTYLQHYSGHLNRMTVKGVNFYGPRSDYVVSGSDCGYIFIWDKKTEAIVQRKHADLKGAVNIIEGHPHIPTLATSGLDKTIKIWEPLSQWKQPNKNELRLSVVKNRVERDERTGVASRDIMGLGIVPFSRASHRYF